VKKTDKGAVTKWAVTTLPPGNLRRGGLTRDLLGVRPSRQHPRLPRARRRQTSRSSDDHLRRRTSSKSGSATPQGKPVRRLFIVAASRWSSPRPRRRSAPGAGAGADASAAAAGKQTPRAADGHFPDLNGVWAGSADAVKALAPGESARILFPVRDEPRRQAHLR